MLTSAEVRAFDASFGLKAAPAGDYASGSTSQAPRPSPENVGRSETIDGRRLDATDFLKKAGPTGH